MPRLFHCFLTACLATACSSQVLAGDIRWERIKLDEAFRSEGVAVADVNKDGKNDVLAGEVWYEAPNWTLHEIRTPGKFVAGVGYSESFACWAYDVNNDGWDDLVHVGFPAKAAFWYENPQNKPGHWKEHLIWHSACNESPDFLDITGDGKPELVMGSEPERQLGYLSIPTADQLNVKWDFRAVNEPGEVGKNGSHRFYHGLGAGDINSDGRTDVLIAHGWYEHPETLDGEPWTFHPWNLSKNGTDPSMACADIHAYDLDLDGDNDLLLSSAHTFGVWWFENVGSSSEPKFEYRLIDESFSQTHAMELVDINGDGTKDIVTGKRFYAHNGHDPGGKDPAVMYWYEITRTEGSAPQFTRHEIEAGRDTGIGTQFLCRDFDGDGLQDVILSNKKGVNVLLQRRD